MQLMEQRFRFQMLVQLELMTAHHGHTVQLQVMQNLCIQIYSANNTQPIHTTISILAQNIDQAQLQILGLPSKES